MDVGHYQILPARDVKSALVQYESQKFLWHDVYAMQVELSSVVQELFPFEAVPRNAIVPEVSLARQRQLFREFQRYRDNVVRLYA